MQSENLSSEMSLNNLFGNGSILGRNSTALVWFYLKILVESTEVLKMEENQKHGQNLKCKVGVVCVNLTELSVLLQYKK